MGVEMTVFAVFFKNFIIKSIAEGRQKPVVWSNSVLSAIPRGLTDFRSFCVFTGLCGRRQNTKGLHILKQRYASGEIDTKKFDRKEKDLE